MNQPKKKTPVWSDSFFENFKDLGTGIVNSAVNDVGKGVAKGVGQGLIDPFFPMHGGEALDRQEPLAQMERREGRPKQTYQDRFREATLLFREQDREIVQQIDGIRSELKMLIKEMGDLSSAVQEAEKAVAMETVAPGKYHVTFFERLRRIISLFRKQMADSRTWLSMSQGKKKRKGFWNMYKKHGTTFGLSQERVIATQAG